MTFWNYALGAALFADGVLAGFFATLGYLALRIRRQRREDEISEACRQQREVMTNDALGMSMAQYASENNARWKREYGFDYYAWYPCGEKDR